jgi:hypothetical protein
MRRQGFVKLLINWETKMNRKLQLLSERLHDALLDHQKEFNSWSQNLAGACAVGSHLLVTEAKRKLNLDVNLWAVTGHVWAEYWGEIYDITATQFGHTGKLFNIKKELISTHGPSWNYYYNSRSFTDLDYINKAWPISQQPKNYQVKWLNQYRARIVRVNG